MNKDEVIICKNESDIVDAIMQDEDIIYIESSLGKKISNIKNTGKIAWGLLIGGVVVAVTAIISSKTLSKGKSVLVSSLATIPSLGVAIAYIGFPSTISLLQIMIDSYKKNNGISGAKNIVLSLRNNYYIAEFDREKMTLKKVSNTEEVKEVKISEIKS
ncbi:hypothetical protein [Brachyspira pilosicoli]|uniref:hypothetical protein n=1 Tax=Brachyspira pilosicoli TaxID=52584 RepID=UPI0030065636